MTGKSEADSGSIGSLVDLARQQPSQYGGDPMRRPKSSKQSKLHANSRQPDGDGDAARPRRFGYTIKFRATPIG
jgi:hypothetical protein